MEKDVKKEKKLVSKLSTAIEKGKHRFRVWGSITCGMTRNTIKTVGEAIAYITGEAEGSKIFGYKNEDWYFACTKEVRLEPKVAIEVVKIDGLKLAEIEYVHINNYDVVKAAVMQNGKALKYASKELKDNPELKALAKEQIANAKAKKKAEKKAEKIESISVNL